jgi:hypothetical protein
MKKFIIVDTFNGEGYSDSSAVVMELLGTGHAKVVCELKARDFCGHNGSQKVFKDRVEYEVNNVEDQGAVHFLKFEDDMRAIAINPTINDFTILRSAEEMEEMEERLSESEESIDGEELEGTCHHMDDEVIIYIKF